jgi:transposase
MNTGVRRSTLIDAFMPYLKKRWEEGCVNAATLYAEITAQGFRGSTQTVRRHLQHWRIAGAPSESRPAVTPRKVTGWIMRRPDELSDDERHQLQQILDLSDEITAAHQLATGFAHLLCQRRGADLETWADQAEACDVREIRSFATTLGQDWDAVVAGLTLAHSNGPTEGNVNRLKLIKRAMFGRANFDLLRRRVLHRA